MYESPHPFSCFFLKKVKIKETVICNIARASEDFHLRIRVFVFCVFFFLIILPTESCSATHLVIYCELFYFRGIGNFVLVPYMRTPQQFTLANHKRFSQAKILKISLLNIIFYSVIHCLLSTSTTDILIKFYMRILKQRT